MRSPIVRRVVAAFAAVTVGEWVLGTTVAIHAYAVGGALLVGLVGFRFAPAAVAGLVAAQFADTHQRERVLTVVALTRAGASGLAAVSLALGLPFAVPLLLVWFDAMAGSAYRPAQAALLPTVVRAPSELTAATAAASNAKSSSQLLGALAGGLLVAGEPVAIAVSAATVFYLAAAFATDGIRTGRTAPRATSDWRERLRRMGAGATALRRDRQAIEIVAYAGLRSLIRGLWMSLGVVAALQLLGLGQAGFGFLMAAAAAGALAAIPLSSLLVGRRRLAPWLAAGLLTCGASIAAIGAIAAGIPALVLVVSWGIGMAISDAAGQALLNRLVPAASIGPVTGFMEGAKLLLEGGGSMIAPVMVAGLGIREALIAAGLAVIALVGAGGRRFARIDVRATGRVDVIELVANVPFFRRLRVDALEGVVAQLEQVGAPAGHEVITQGDLGDARWFLVEEGELSVEIEGFLVNELVRGDGFGELALMRDAPRAATVRARSAVSLLALERAAFLAAIGGPDLEASDDLPPPAAEAGSHADILGRTALLQGVGERALEELARGALVCRAEAGTSIVVEGHLDDRFFVLLSGRAVVIIGTERRRVLLPGDGFGEIAALHRVPRSATVLAEEACRLLTMTGEDLRVAARERGGLLGKLAVEVESAGADSIGSSPGGERPGPWKPSRP